MSNDSMSESHKKKGKIFFISGPSGVGKGTLISALRERHLDWEFPPSCTTRDPRKGEINGKTYFFISRKKFQEKIDAGDFLEYAEVHQGNLYGTLKNKLLNPVKLGKIVIREFDVQGFDQARKKLDHKDYISIFLQTEGGAEELVKRITERAPMSEEELAHRIKSMKNEFIHAKLYDYVVFSRENQIEQMIIEVEEIITDNS
jgi:guanylate kinase